MRILARDGAWYLHTSKTAQIAPPTCYSLVVVLIFLLHSRSIPLLSPTVHDSRNSSSPLTEIRDRTRQLGRIPLDLKHHDPYRRPTLSDQISG